MTVHRESAIPVAFLCKTPFGLALDWIQERSQERKGRFWAFNRPSVCGDIGLQALRFLAEGSRIQESLRQDASFPKAPPWAFFPPTGVIGFREKLTACVLRVMTDYAV